MKPQPALATRTPVFRTPFFDLVAKTVTGEVGAPHYAVQTHDYVCVIALTTAQEMLLVRQFRPAIEQTVLELPAGHVDPGETPVEAAARELLEETGYAATQVESLGELWPDTGRLSNHMWCFFASDVQPAGSAPPREPGIELVRCARSDWPARLGPPVFQHALHLAALHLAVLRGRLRLADLTPGNASRRAVS